MRKVLMIIVATGLLATGACSTNKATTVNVAGKAAPPPTIPVTTCPQWDLLEAERIPMGINQLANLSDAAITGEVTAISSPRWNSQDGNKWCPPAQGPTPIQFRDVTVKVSDVAFRSDKLAARPGDALVVRAFGDGTTTGKEIYKFGPNANDPVLTKGQADGHFEVGKEVFLFVSVWDQFPSQAGLERVNQVTGSWGGNFEVDRRSDMAKSVEPGRTVPYSALIARVKAERQQGRKPERDVASRKNPLAE